MPKHSCNESGEPICTIGGHLIVEDFYTINPIGGYGMDEVLCCETCIKKPENIVVRQRMIDLGAKELL